MGGNLTYLLRTGAAITAFREAYAEEIRTKGPILRDWFQKKPLYEWRPLKCKPGTEAIFIGILCILYLDGEIALTFSDNGEHIMRRAVTDEEFESYAGKIAPAKPG